MKRIVGLLGLFCFHGTYLFTGLFTGAALAAAPVTGLAFSPDGSALAVAAGRKLVLRLPRGGPVLPGGAVSPGGKGARAIDCGLPRAAAVAFQPGGDLLAVAGGSPGESGAVVLVRWKTGEVAARVGSFRDLATAAAFASGGKLLAVASADGSGRLYRIADGAPPAEAARLEGHTGPILAAAFGPEGGAHGGLILTAGADRTIKVWAAGDGRLLRSLSGHAEAVNALALRPERSQAASAGIRPVVCASGGDDRTARIWQPEDGRMVRIVRKHEGAVLAVLFGLEGASWYTAGAEGVIRRIDAESDEVRGSWKASSDWIYSLALSPDGKLLAAGDARGAVSLWEVGPEGDLRPASGEPR